MTTIPTPAHIVLCAHHAGGYSTERNFTDMTRAQTISDIASGQIEPRVVVQVIEIDLSARTSRDVSKEIAREVMHRWADRGEELTTDEYEFVEFFVSTQAANSFRRAA